MAEQRKSQMQSEIKSLEDTCERLTRENKQMEQEIEDMINKDENERLAESKAHQDKVNYLNELNADYKSDLEKQLSAPSNQK